MTPATLERVTGSCGLAQHEANRCAPEMEPSPVDRVDGVALKVAKIAQIATEPHMIAEKAHHADAGIQAKLVVGDFRHDTGVRDAGHLRADRSEADVPYGRIPGPLVPPTGIPTMRFPMAVSTWLSP